MSNLSSGDEEIMRLATEGDDDTKLDAKPEAEAKEPLELGGDEAPEATPEEVKADEEKKKTRSHSLTNRVNVLTARLRDAERRAAELEAKGPSDTPANDDDKAPDPNQYEFGEADPNYIRAAAVYDVKKEFKEERTKSAEQQKQDEQQRQLTERVTSGMSAAEKQAREAYGDFDDVIQSSLEARDGEPLPPLVSIGCAVSPVGGHVAYHLAKNEADSEKIEKLAETDPRKAAVMLGELEGQYLDDDDDTDLDLADQWDLLRQIGRERARRKGLTKPTTIKTTRAPVEEKRARGSAGKFEADDDTTDFKAFERKIMGGRQ